MLSPNNNNNPILKMFTNLPQLRLTEIQKLISKKKSKEHCNPDRTQASTTNLMEVKQPYYLKPGWREKLAHKNCGHDCMACRLISNQTQPIKTRKIKSIKKKPMVTYLSNRESSPQTFFKDKLNLPTLLQKPKTKQKQTRKDQPGSKQIFDQFCLLKKHFLPKLLSGHGIKQLSQPKQRQVENLLQQYVFNIFNKNKEMLASERISKNTNQKAIKDKQVLMEWISQRAKKNEKQKIELQTESFLSKLYSLINIQQVISKKKVKKLGPKVQRYTHIFVEGEQNEELLSVLRDLAEVQMTAFKEHINSIGDNMEKKLNDLDNDEKKQEFHSKMTQRFDLIKNILMECEQMNKVDKKKKLKIITHRIHRLLKSSSIPQNKFEKGRISIGSESQIEGSLNQSIPTKPKGMKSNRSLKYSKKTFTDKFDGLDQIDDKKSFDSDRNDFDMKNIQDELLSKIMSSALTISMEGQFDETSENFSMKEIGYGEKKTNRYSSLSRKSKGQLIQQKRSREKVGPETFDKLGDEGNTGNFIQKTRNRRAQKNLLSKFNEEFQLEQVSKNQQKRIYTIQAERKLTENKTLIQYAERYLKSRSLESLILHPHNGIFMKKKKIRHLREIINSLYNKKQINQSILDYLFQYLSLYEENCKLLMGKNEQDEEQQNNTGRSQLNIINYKDYYKKLYFYDLDQNFQMDIQTENEYFFTYKPKEQQPEQQEEDFGDLEIKNKHSTKIDAQNDVLVQTSIDSRVYLDQNIYRKPQIRQNSALSTPKQSQNQIFQQSSAFFKVKKLLDDRRSKSKLKTCQHEKASP